MLICQVCEWERQARLQSSGTDRTCEHVQQAITEAVAERDKEWSEIIETYIDDDSGGHTLKVAMHAAIRKVKP